MIFTKVSARLFPWDFVDEEPDDILDTLEREARVTSFYPVILMHDEKRPLSEFYYAHNPRRKVYWAEDPELMEVKRGFYHAIRRAVGLDKHFVTALSQRVRATPALIVETIRMRRDDDRPL